VILPLEPPSVGRHLGEDILRQQSAEADTQAFGDEVHPDGSGPI
jgi:hypothetical protein